MDEAVDYSEAKRNLSFEKLSEATRNGFKAKVSQAKISRGEAKGETNVFLWKPSEGKSEVFWPGFIL